MKELMANNKETPIVPISPCPHCGSTRYGIIDNLWMEMVSESERDYGNTLKFRYTARVCSGCGATTLFARSGKGGLLESDYIRIVGD